jgi:hypothetical protein
MSNETKISMAFKPLVIKAAKPEDIFINHRIELATKIIEAIIYCVENNKSKVVFAHFVLTQIGEIIVLNIDKVNFLENLEINLATLIEYEQYELCTKAIKAKEKILSKIKK